MRENHQVPLAADYTENGSVLLHSYFPTIQGEGPFCGDRALFFRLYGCNLRCPGCDTEYTAKQSHVQPAFFVNAAKEAGWRENDLVVITGGEPFRQNVGPMIDKLLEAGYRVQVETNGVLAPDNIPWDHPRFTVVCSPKTSHVHMKVLAYAAAFKYIIRAGEVDETDGMPTRALLHKASPRVARPAAPTQVYVQPMDEDDPAANALNLDAAIRSAMVHGHRLQIQIHKICNLE